jgi:hypothetical protein
MCPSTWKFSSIHVLTHEASPRRLQKEILGLVNAIYLVYGLGKSWQNCLFEALSRLNRVRSCIRSETEYLLSAKKSERRLRLIRAPRPLSEKGPPHSHILGLQEFHRLPTG